MPSPDRFKIGIAESAAWVTEIEGSTGLHIVIQEKSKVGALVSHPLCPVGSWGACTPPATAPQAHLFSPVASALWPLPTTPPFLLLFPHSPPSYVFSHTFSSSFLASLRHYTPRAPGPMHSPWQHREAPPVSLGDPPTPKRATAEAKETLAGAYRFY